MRNQLATRLLFELSARERRATLFPDCDVPGPPLKFSAAATRRVSRAPDLGEHTADILRGWLGLDDTHLQRLRVDGVI